MTSAPLPTTDVSAGTPENLWKQSTGFPIDSRELSSRRRLPVGIGKPERSRFREGIAELDANGIRLSGRGLRSTREQIPYGVGAALILAIAKYGGYWYARSLRATQGDLPEVLSNLACLLVTVAIGVGGFVLMARTVPMTESIPWIRILGLEEDPVADCLRISYSVGKIYGKRNARTEVLPVYATEECRLRDLITALEFYSPGISGRALNRAPIQK